VRKLVQSVAFIGPIVSLYPLTTTTDPSAWLPPLHSGLCARARARACGFQLKRPDLHSPPSQRTAVDTIC
jgi:hypothetical protein